MGTMSTDLETFTAGVMALSWLAAILAMILHLVGVYAGWWSHTNPTTYGAPLVAMGVNIIATVMTVRL